MNLKEFYALIDSGKDPDRTMLDDLHNLIKKYPLFQAGIFVYIKCLYVNDIDLFSVELRRLSAFVHDRRALFYYVMSDVYEQFNKHLSTKQIADRTDILISAFFETHEDKEAERRLEHAIVNSSMASFDYFSFLDSSHNIENNIVSQVTEGTLIDSPVLLETNSEIETVAGTDIEEVTEGDTVEMKHQSIIDNFISQAEDSENLRIKLEPLSDTDVEAESSTDKMETEEELDDDFFFTQTLANIYIKQKKYKRAYEIIKRLSLNYPEKNIYFADQLSFLEKLIKNSK